MFASDPKRKSSLSTHRHHQRTPLMMTNGNADAKAGFAFDTTSARGFSVAGVNAHHFNRTFFENSSPGIVHRLENAAAFTSPSVYSMPLDESDAAPSMFSLQFGSFFPSSAPTSSDAVSATRIAASPPPMTRCPCCRESSAQLLCVVCALQHMRRNKICDIYHDLFRRKADLCHRIGQQLRQQTDTELDIRTTTESIQSLKAVIAAKRDKIKCLRLRLSNVTRNVDNVRNNNLSLTNKTSRHEKQFEAIVASMLEHRGALTRSYADFTRQIAALVADLTAVYPLEALTRTSPRRVANAPDGGAPDSWRNALQHNAHAFKRPTYFMIRKMTLNDQCDFETLLDEEHCRILDHSKSKSMLGNITGAVITPPRIHGCSTKPCRQTMAALLFTAKILDLLSFLLDKSGAYERLHSEWSQLCSVYQKEAQSQPHDGCGDGHNALRASLFKLRLAVTIVGALCGALAPRQTEFCAPTYHLLSVINTLSGRRARGSPGGAKNEEEKKHSDFLFSPVPDAFDAKLHAQILEDFQKIHWEDHQNGFSFDNIEEDWVKVAMR